jgi:hypothetical protein
MYNKKPLLFFIGTRGCNTPPFRAGSVIPSAGFIPRPLGWFLNLLIFLTGFVLFGCKPLPELSDFSAVKIKDRALFFWIDPAERDLENIETIEISFVPEVPGIKQPVRAAKGDEAALISGLDPYTDYTFTIRTVRGKKKSEGTDPVWYDVYAAGYDSGSALLWKNGIPQVLSDHGTAHALVISGADLFVGGEINNRGGYWKNGEFTPLANWLAVTGIALEGGKLYLTGSRQVSPGNNGVAQWVDGEETVLAVNARRSLGYQAVSRRVSGSLNEITTVSGGAIAVNGTDVYTIFKCDIRYILTHPGGSYTTRTASEQMLFKNGERLPLPGASGGNLYDLAVSGADIYLAGSDNKIAAFWKNGERSILTDGQSSFSAAMGLVVKDGDVYITGYDGRLTKIWKNGEQLLVSDGEAPDTQGNAAALFGPLALAAGYVKNNAEKTIAVIWAGTKKLQAIPLSDGSGNADALSIAIVPR